MIMSSRRLTGNSRDFTNRQMQTLSSLWIKTASLSPLQVIPTILTPHPLHHLQPAISLPQGGIARLLGEKEFTILFHEGEKDNIHISLIGQRVILVVIFDQRSSLGLVRLRVKKAAEALGRIFDEIASKSEKEKVEGGKAADSPFAEISDEDIDNLFK